VSVITDLSSAWVINGVETTIGGRHRGIGGRLPDGERARGDVESGVERHARSRFRFRFERRET